MDWRKFDYSLGNLSLETMRHEGIYTYIARSEDKSVYKIGCSRFPQKREKNFAGHYKSFGFTITHLFPGKIEPFVLFGLVIAGAKLVQSSDGHAIKEAFYLHPRSVECLIRRCGFRPREEFGL